MKRSTRALVGLLVLDGLLLTGTWWMVMQTKTGAWHASDPADAIQTIMSTMGTVIGAVTGILGLVWAIQRRRGN